MSVVEKTDIKSMNYEELSRALSELSLPKFRTKQVYEWIHKKLVSSFDEMTNLSVDLRKQLNETFELNTATVDTVQTSQIDGTQKYLFRFKDNSFVESVLMKYHHGNSVCISSQVGCRMGCRFCASTLDGLTRSLQPSEMLEQIYRIQALTGERVSSGEV